MRPQDLVEGNAYFLLGYAGSNANPRVYPLIDTMIYRGTDEVDGERVWIFSSVDASEPDDDEDAELVAFGEEMLVDVRSLGDLIEALSASSASAMLSEPPRTIAPPAEVAGWPDAVRWSKRLAAGDDEIRAVTVMQKFTRFGVRFERAESGRLIVEDSFLMVADDARRAAFRAVAEAQGWKHVRSETRGDIPERVLVFDVVDEKSVVPGLVAIFSEVYPLAVDDVVEVVVSTTDYRLVDAQGEPLPPREVSVIERS